MKTEILNYAKKQGYTLKDLTNKKCFRCYNFVFKEKGKLKKEYPFYCANCDENMFNFEVRK